MATFTKYTLTSNIFSSRECKRKLRTSYIILLSSCLLCLASCQKAKQSNVILAEKPAEEKPKPTQSIGDYEQTFPLQWQGKSYQVTVQRKADKSLPTVKEGTQSYFDNRILVNVMGADNTVFFAKEFTKEYFAQHISPKTLQKSVLLGVVYNRVEGDKIYFAASVGSPDQLSDEYIPFDVVLTRDGSLTTTKAEREDSASDLEDEI